MIKITNGINVFNVTKGAFDAIYSHQGFSIIKQEIVEDEYEIQEEEQVFEFNYLLEKPIGQWNKDEVIGFAKENDIDLSGTKGIQEAKEIIKEFL